MKAIIRKGFSLVLLLLLLSIGITAWATAHRYDTGIVSSITNKEIVMAGKVYKILPTTKVVLKEKSAKGAYYERRGRLSSLNAGEKVFLKVTGYDIIEVEVWR